MRFGPVTNGLRISPTGSKDSLLGVPATMPVIASTGAKLVIGHKAPLEVSAIACRIDPRSGSQTWPFKTSFWGPAMPPKSPSTLVTHTLRHRRRKCPTYRSRVASAARAASLCAGHAQQFGGESPLANLMEVKA